MNDMCISWYYGSHVLCVLIVLIVLTYVFQRSEKDIIGTINTNHKFYKLI